MQDADQNESLMTNILVYLKFDAVGTVLYLA